MQSQVQPFIRNVQAAPEAMCVLANNQQLNDIVRFCCEFSTFNLGESSVTVTTFRHLQLLERNTKKPPVLIGPMLVHQRKTTQSYHFLASSMVAELSEIKAFGSDGEKALGDAFQCQFPKSLICYVSCM